MKHYRIKPQFSQTIDGRPSMNYAVQERTFGVWYTIEKGMNVFTDKVSAQLHLADLQDRELLKWEFKKVHRSNVRHKLTGWTNKRR